MAANIASAAASLKPLSVIAASAVQSPTSTMPLPTGRLAPLMTVDVVPICWFQTPFSLS